MWKQNQVFIPLSGEVFPPGTTSKENEKLDVFARNLWAPLAKAFVDIRVLQPQAPSNGNKSIPATYRAHELETKRKYNARVINIERATFTPLVFSSSGGMGSEASVFYKRVAKNRQQTFSEI